MPICRTDCPDEGRSGNRSRCGYEQGCHIVDFHADPERHRNLRNNHGDWTALAIAVRAHITMLDPCDIVEERIGTALLLTACRSTSEGSLHALWLGPDEWLDVTHRQVALSIRGERAEDILASGCALDLSETSFTIGMCTRTMFHKAEMVLWRTGADSFHLEVWRSFARYVEGLLRIAEGEA
jgi:sarcosine oxidase, subunit gamma